MWLSKKKKLNKCIVQDIYSATGEHVGDVSRISVKL